MVPSITTLKQHKSLFVHTFWRQFETLKSQYNIQRQEIYSDNSSHFWVIKQNILDIIQCMIFSFQNHNKILYLHQKTLQLMCIKTEVPKRIRILIYLRPMISYTKYRICHFRWEKCDLIQYITSAKSYFVGTNKKKHIPQIFFLVQLALNS